MPTDRIEDRRVRRTRRLLHGALASLIHEKPFGAIGVKEILARADVGRSTFYAHFPDKEALLASAIRESLPAREGSAVRTPADLTADPVERVLRFSLPLLEHIAGVDSGRSDGSDRPDRHARTVLHRPRAHAALHARVRPVLVEWVAVELEAVAHARGGALRVPADLLAGHVADTFLRVLEWWALGTERRSARELNGLFRSLAEPAIAVALPAPAAAAVPLRGV